MALVPAMISISLRTNLSLRSDSGSSTPLVYSSSDSQRSPSLWLWSAFMRSHSALSQNNLSLIGGSPKCFPTTPRTAYTDKLCGISNVLSTSVSVATLLKTELLSRHLRFKSLAARLFWLTFTFDDRYSGSPNSSQRSLHLG